MDHLDRATREISTAASFLFVPASRPDRFAKAAASGADLVILDLEDAVAADGKDEARWNAALWTAEHASVVRINALGSPWATQDIQRLRDCEQLKAIMVPKARDAQELVALSQELGRHVPLVALIESAAGVMAAPSIATTSAVARLAFGNLDFAADCGMSVTHPDEPELMFARSALVLASRAAGLPGPIDGVTVNTQDREALAFSTRRAARLGFTGKLCIHPTQVPVAAVSLAPTEDEVAWANRVVEGAKNHGPAFVLGGEMIDSPVILRARSVLARLPRTAS